MVYFYGLSKDSPQPPNSFCVFMLDKNDVTLLRGMFTEQESRMYAFIQQSMTGQDTRTEKTIEASTQAQDVRTAKAIEVSAQAQDVRVREAIEASAQAQDVRVREAIEVSAQAQDSRFREAIHQSNNDLKHELRDEMQSLIRAAESRIISSIADLLDTAILPQINELRVDMTKVKLHLRLA